MCTGDNVLNCRYTSGRLARLWSVSTTQAVKVGKYASPALGAEEEGKA
jgi:hypothetical protein